MLFYIIFIHYFSIVLATLNVFSTYLGDDGSYDSDEKHRDRRDSIDRDYDNYVKSDVPPCKQLRRTGTSPFAVVILYKTSGRYLGMGSIIDKQTVLTASKVVVASLHKPSKILGMAGRRSAWWGTGAQVQPAKEIFLSGSGLAILRLENPFQFNKFVKPIQLSMNVPTDEAFMEEFDKHWVVLGIPRSSWNVPGELTPKPNIYVLRVETIVEKKEDLQMCGAFFPDLLFNETVMTCTIANGSFCWGCMGSPVVAVDKGKQVVQIGVVIRTTTTDEDKYHALVKTGFFDQWIRSYSLIGFPRPL